MKNKIIVVLVFTISCLSCSVNQKKITGLYISSCFLHTEPNVLVQLKSNGEFVYKLAYLEDSVKGMWTLNEDTLMLVSEFFTDDYKLKKFPDVPLTLTPQYKVTDVPEKDLFILKYKKLYPINKSGIYKSCILFKQKKKHEKIDDF